jgi:heme/copper-type cytochrome/quinol oxidase subunit 2
MIAIGVLFVLVFAIMLYSLIAHRRASEHGAHRFFGPTGTVQWLWALVPFAILAFIGNELTDGANGMQPVRKIELATAHPLAGGLPALVETPSVGDGKPTARDQPLLRATVLR